MTDDPKLLPVGKLPIDRLRSFLTQLPPPDRRLVVGPRIGEDAAVIDAGDRYLVVSTDPITFATDRIGWYAVHVNANDVAVMGARPLWFSVVVLLPGGRATSRMFETIMDDVKGACGELGVTLCGGHTEITGGLARPIVVGQMIGEVEPAGLVRKERMQVGDQVLLTRGIAIEGTAILARERFERLRDRVGSDLLARAARLLTDPGISVVSAALAAAGVGGVVHAMHDPTEGGLANGLSELVSSSGLGVRVQRERIQVLPETEAIASVLGLDPMNLLASGALVIAVSPEGTEQVLAGLRARGVAVAVIGEIRPGAERLTIREGGRVAPLDVKDRDEIARAWDA